MTVTTADPKQWEFGGTGLSLVDLDEKPRHEREAILAGTIDALRDVLADLKHSLTEAEGYLRDAMLERGATVADAGEWEVRLRARRRYTYDEERLSGLQAFIEVEQYDGAVHVERTVTVDKRRLNELVKRGGEVAEIINAATTEQFVGYEVDVARRKR